VLVALFIDVAQGKVRTDLSIKVYEALDRERRKIPKSMNKYSLEPLEGCSRRSGQFRIR
jgi:hypothetical protein